jgi:hypothetical protein
MARKRKKEVTPTNPIRWTWKDVEAYLKEIGAVEIPKKMWNQEPYKTYMKGIKRNGKFVCE